MTPELRSRADVVTPASERYATRLDSYLGRSPTFVTDGLTSTVEQVLGSLLERFGARDVLAVTWERS